MPTNSPKTVDVVVEARELLRNIALKPWQFWSPDRALITRLCDEVERLRNQQKVHAEMVDDYYGSR